MLHDGPVPRNLELKAHDANPRATVAACEALGASDFGELHQRDSYFTVRQGRLKLREDFGAATAELIFYERPDSTAVRESTYVRVPADRQLLSVLADALGVWAVVEKRRRLFIHRHVRIHLDDVADLGSFVELEAVLPEASEEALAEVMAALSFEKREPIAESYSDLVSR